MIMNKLNDTKPTAHQFMNLIDEWHKEHNSDKGVITFQNHKFHANVILDNTGVHEIMKHTRGAENLPEAIINPSEVWSKWGDVNQRVVLRNYILLGSNGNYVVQTKDGIIQNGIFVVNSSLDKFRKGLILLL